MRTPDVVGDIAMELVKEDSLGLTLDAINEALFFGRDISDAQKLESANWIAGRQGLPGSYADMFGITDYDRSSGYMVFTGEKIKTRAGTSHILGEEASRALILLDVKDQEVTEALARATEGMMSRLVTQSGEIPQSCGIYCCGICSVSYWRHLAAGGLCDADIRLEAAMETLSQHRIGDGRWKRFPFYYTLLALTEINNRQVLEERRYAAPICESYLNRKPKEDEISNRRRAVAERILAMC